MERICLWSSPRNISTAMMYSFAQRNDTIVFDEPLYAHYLSITSSDHPGREEILQAQQKDGEAVVRNVILAEYEKPVAFFKQMTHHLINLNQDFLSQTKNIIFIRNPKQIIASYAQVRKEVDMNDIGIRMQWDLFNHLTTNNLNCIVLDSGELLKAPEKILRQLCDLLEIKFQEGMLHWPAGAKSYDGIWAKYWYDNVYRSAGFETQKTSARALPAYLEALYEESKPYYERLFTHSLKA